MRSFFCANQKSQVKPLLLPCFSFSGSALRVGPVYGSGNAPGASASCACSATPSLILDDDQILGVSFLGRFREVEATGHDTGAVQNHDFVVRDGVFCVDEDRDTGVQQKGCAAVLFRSLGLVEDRFDVDATTGGVGQGTGDGRRGERVCLNVDGFLSLPDGCDKKTGAVFARGETQSDWAGGSRCRLGPQEWRKARQG